MDIIALNKQISQDLTIIAEQVTFHEKRAAEFKKTTPGRAVMHSTTAEKMRSVADHLVIYQVALSELKNVTSPKPIKMGHQLSLSLQEIEELPAELVNELSIDKDKPEFIIEGLIDEAGGILSLDRILIGLYKKTGEIHKRPNLNNRLYRMVQRGEIFSVAGKKAAYSTRELTSQQVEEILNPNAAKSAPQVPQLELERGQP